MGNFPRQRDQIAFSQEAMLELSQKPGKNEHSEEGGKSICKEGQKKVHTVAEEEGGGMHAAEFHGLL